MVEGWTIDQSEMSHATSRMVLFGVKRSVREDAFSRALKIVLNGFGKGGRSDTTTCVIVASGASPSRWSSRSV